MPSMEFDSGWIYVSSGRATGALNVASGIVVETAPYFRFCRGRTVPEVIVGLAAPQWKVMWFPDEPVARVRAAR